VTRVLLASLCLIASELMGLRDCSLPEGLSSGEEQEAPSGRGRRRRRDRESQYGPGVQPVQPMQPAQPWVQPQPTQPVALPQPVPSQGPGVAPVQPTVPSQRAVGVRRLPFSDSERVTEVNRTLDLIESGGPFPFRQDGVVFHNREGRLPNAPFGTYHEYTVVTPGLTHRGPRRIVTGAPPTTWYTDDHYRSFVVIDPRRY